LLKLEICQTDAAETDGHGASWPQEQPLGSPTLLYRPADLEAVCKLGAAGNKTVI